jgi:hypothetical protein
MRNLRAHRMQPASRDGVGALKLRFGSVDAVPSPGGFPMNQHPIVLVSCSGCHQLHTPPNTDVSHPLCPRCTPIARRPARFDARPLAR